MLSLFKVETFILSCDQFLIFFGYSVIKIGYNEMTKRKKNSASAFNSSIFEVIVFITKIV
jgi:hypothetical protein